jgi:hypothetical protein
MRIISAQLLIAACLAFAATPVAAELNSPKAGWRAELNGLHHNVGGTVTIVDDDSLRFDDFTYDGQGLDVRFYLGATDSQASFISGVPIGPQLLGMVFDGSQSPFVIDMPIGQTLEGWHAISVWCVDVAVNFGSGAFVAAPQIAGDFNGDTRVDAADYTVWRDGLNSEYSPMQYDDWKGNFGFGTSGIGSGSTELPLSVVEVPEPPSGVFAAIGFIIAGSSLWEFNRRRPIAV